MFPKEWTALVGMAGVASFVCRLLDQHLRTRGAMGVVAFRTRSLTGQNRVGGEQMGLRPLRLVTSEANIRLGDPLQHLVFGGMGRMAVAANHALHFMLTPSPMGAQAALVAANAFIILGGWRSRFVVFGFRPVNDVGCRPPFLTGIAFQMGITLSMALLARRGARIGLVAVRCLVDGEDGLAVILIVAACAHFILVQPLGWFRRSVTRNSRLD